MVSRAAFRDHTHESRLFTRRASIAFAFIALLLLVLAARLFYLQIVGYEHFRSLAHDNRVRIQALPPVRGLIYDRHGALLADNLATFRLELVPEQIADLDATLQQLKSLLELAADDLERFHALRARRPGHEGIALRLQLEDEEMARVAVHLPQLPGVHVRAALMRDYPHAEATAHVLGYVGRIDDQEIKEIDAIHYQGTTHIGKSGVEKAYEHLLHGKVGYQQIETNAQGRRLRVLSETLPVPGQNLYLTIDLELQKAAEEALSDYEGAVVALDPRNGEILALVSKPGYDPNLFVQGISTTSYQALKQAPDRPLFNRAVRGTYPPGSTIKPFLGLAGLEYGIIDTHTQVFCPGFYRLPRTSRPYRDWKRGGHGATQIEKAIVQSCDVFYYDLARNMGIERMHDFLERFGLGRETGIDISGEHPGLLPNEAWKRGALNEPWYTGETLIAGIGQGFMLTTPLQLAHSTALLASRGVAYRPRLLLAFEDPRSGRQSAVQATPWRPVKLLKPEHWDTVIRAMTRVVHGERGTARRIGADSPFHIAGKTGTAQVFSLKKDQRYDAETLDRSLHDHALFIAFAPAEQPRIALAVVVEHGGSGSAAAAPVARAILDAWGARYWPPVPLSSGSHRVADEDLAQNARHESP